MKAQHSVDPKHKKGHADLSLSLSSYLVFRRGSHEGHPVILASQQSPHGIQTTLMEPQQNKPSLEEKKKKNHNVLTLQNR